MPDEWINKNLLIESLCENCRYCKNNEPCEDCEVMAVIEEQPVIDLDRGSLYIMTQQRISAKPKEIKPARPGIITTRSMYECPGCGCEVLVTDNFCPCCGQPLDWSEYDETD